MASSYTTNLGLCQWVASDAVLRTDFNNDNAKLDQAYQELRDEVSVGRVYVGSGDMPDGYCVQIDPDGEMIDDATLKAAIVAEVLAELPTWEGGSY